MGLDSQSIRAALPNLSRLPPDEQREILDIMDRLDDMDAQEESRQDFMHFVGQMWPSFIEGAHHQIMAEKFQAILNGDLKRLIINMPPRHTKSEFASYLLPAWFLGNFPDKKIIQTAHTAELSVGFGRKVRNLVSSDDFRRIFPGVALASDSKAAGRWNTNHGGDYFAIGVGGAVTGKGADLFIIDDPHSEQEAQMGDASVFDRVHEWYTSGPRQRLQPGGAICIVMTRWSQRDLTGQLVKSMGEREGADQWDVVEFPAILDDDEPMWPEFWSKKELIQIKSALPASKWAAQYQQDPTSDEAAIIKRTWWRWWEEVEPPPCEFIIQSWDTAFLKTQRADYSACTTWGVFYDEGASREKDQPKVILLNAFQERLEFPELKERAYEAYQFWKPDACIVESKAAGTPLIFELRKMGIPVSEYSPTRGNDKVARVNSVSDLFSSGIVWVPRRRFAEEVVEQFAGFPGAAAHDDLVDSSTQALIRFRQGGFLKLGTDYEDSHIRRRPYSPYG